MSAHDHGRGHGHGSGHDHSHSHGQGHEHGQGHGSEHEHGQAHAGGPMPWVFNEETLARLSDPGRLETLPPDAIWGVLAASAPRPLRVLVDLGTGIGFFALPFARKMPDGLLYACDVSAEALAYLGEALRRAGATNIVPVLSEAVRVPLEDSLADALAMINVHHHLESRPDTLAECRRLLKSGGCVLVVDWRPGETEHGPPVEHRVTPAAVRAELEAAGFRDVAEHDILSEHWCLTARR
jgi:SAM-dependent methyltransferase